MSDTKMDICLNLWQEYENDMRRICKIKLRDIPDEIDDVISDTFMALCNHVSQNGSPEKPKAWLYSTLYNQINLRFRKLYINRENQTIDDDNKEFTLKFQEDFSETLLNKLFLEQLMLIIEDQLTNDEKVLLNYIYYDELKTNEIASLLSINTNTVRQRHYRLCNKIRKLAKKILKKT